MKIGYIIPSLANKGPILVVKDLVKVFVENNHMCHVFYLTDLVEVEMQCPVQKIRFTEAIDFNDFDIIHTHGLRPDAYVFFHRSKSSQTRFISTIHSYVIPDLSFQYNKLIGLTLGYIWMKILFRHDRVVVLSRDAMKYYSKWIPQKKLTYAYNTRSIDKNIPLSNKEAKEISLFKKDSILIGVNCILTHRKGVDLLIRALVQLPHCKLCIVGDGKIKDKLISMAQDNKVIDRCLFTGYKKEAYRYLPYYDIYAMPSRSEGFGLAWLEAAYFRKPVVCSNIPIFKELLTSREVAFFDLEDLNSLVYAISSNVDKDLGERLYQRCIKDYSPTVFYERYEDIYQNLL